MQMGQSGWSQSSPLAYACGYAAALQAGSKLFLVLAQEASLKVQKSRKFSY